MKHKNAKLSLLLPCLLWLSACQPNQSKQANEQQNAIATEGINQQQLDQLADSLQVNYRFFSNVETECAAIDSKKADYCNVAEITLSSPNTIQADDWSLFYSQIYTGYSAESEHFNLKHLNGDLHQITPKDGFKGFEAGKNYKVKVWVKGALLSESELLPNYWLAANGLSAKVVSSTKTLIDQETQLEVQPYITPFTDYLKQIKSAHEDENKYASAGQLFKQNIAGFIEGNQKANDLASAIIPTPENLIVNQGHLAINNGVKYQLTNLDRETVSAAIKRLSLLGIKEQQATNATTVNISVVANTDKPSGSYQLSINENEISIVGVDTTGAFYGLQSLAAIVTLGETNVPLVEVTDSPRYQYRGQHLDVSRNFLSKQYVLTLIEQMAAYKLNKLHLHLAEDEAWRLELPSLPELTEIGSHRCLATDDKHCMQPQLGSAGESQRDGFYSANDYQEILRYASQHHVQVIPSLDMPGHSRSAVKAMEARYHKYMQAEDREKAEQYLLTDFDDKTVYSSIQHYNDNTINVCMESSYAFVDRVLEDLIALHQQANHPLNMYHIGADETAGAWLESPVCKALVADKSNDVDSLEHLGAHFIERVAHMITNKGISVGGWNDGLGETRADKMPKDVYSYIWGALPWGAHQQLSEQAHRKWNIVLSTPDLLYFDFSYQVDPKERGNNWAARQINSRDIFNFMPDNLPIHAEFRLDALGKPYQINDTAHIVDQETGEQHKPLPQGFVVNGIQGQLWTELVRSEQQAQYMMFPRMIVLAERAWHKPDWQVSYNYQGAIYDQKSQVFSQELQRKRDIAWQQFSQTLAQKEFAKLEQAGVFYRLPTIGAVIDQGVLTANSIFAGLPIEYRETNGDWLPYTKPVKVSGNVEVRSLTFDGGRKGRSLNVPFY